MKVLSRTASVLGLCVACACSRDRPQRTSETKVTAGELVMPNEEAIGQIASARCNRAATCLDGAVQAGCVERVRQVLAVRIGARACPLGIDRQQLRECVQDAERAVCSDPMDAFERYLACRAAELCPRIAP